MGMKLLKPERDMKNTTGSNLFVVTVTCLLILLVGGGSYLLGRKSGYHEAMRGEAIGNLAINDLLVSLVDRGDTNQLKSKLRFLTWMRVTTYDRFVGNQPVTNVHFAQVLTRARTIASEARPQALSIDSILKTVNGTTNAN